MPNPRDARFAALRADGAFDVIVVGGGINGIGVFRELALQGLRVLLVERNDFCSGCSAAPSRMIHGGLRYLENGEFDLVRESLRERDALLRNAPHLVKPLATSIPIMSVFSGLMNGAASFLGVSTRPARRGAVPVKLGLSIYDWVTRRRRMLPRHRFLSSRAAFRRWPKLTPRHAVRRRVPRRLDQLPGTARRRARPRYLPRGARTPSRSTTPRSRSPRSRLRGDRQRDRRPLPRDGEGGRQRYRRLAR